ENQINLCGLFCPVNHGGSPHSARPVGRLEELRPVVNGLRVTGWALDVNTTAPITVQAYFNDVPAGAASANLSHADVDNVYHVGPNHGFDMIVPATTDGKVCVYAVRNDTGANSALGCSPVIPGNPAVPIITAPFSCTTTLTPAFYWTTVNGAIRYWLLAANS